MGWLITFGVLLALAALPLGIRIRYNEVGLLARVIVGPIKITVFPRRQKEKKSPEKKAENQEKDNKMEETLPKPPQPPAKEEAPKAEKGGKLTDFLPLIRLALDFLGDFRRALRMDQLYLRLMLAASDPCDLAVNYGRAWAAVGNLIPTLERLFVIKKRDIEVACDFTAPETLVIAHVDVTISLGRLLSLAAVYGIRAVREYLRMKRKGGAVT